MEFGRRLIIESAKAIVKEKGYKLVVHGKVALLFCPDLASGVSGQLLKDQHGRGLAVTVLMPGATKTNDARSRLRSTRHTRRCRGSFKRTSPFAVHQAGHTWHLRHGSG